MNIRENNLKVIREKAYYLYEQLEKTIHEDELTIDMYTNKKYEITQGIAKDGNVITFVEVKNKRYRLNSAYAPINEASIWAKQYESERYGRTNRTIYIYGLGNGYFIRELLKTIDKEDRIIIYEPILEMFNYTLNNFEIEDIVIDKRVLIFINNDRLKEAISQYREGMIYKDSAIITLPQYDKIFSEEKIWFLNLYRDNLIESNIDRNTAAFYGKKWAKITMDNLVPALKSRVLNSFKNLIPSEVPVIIVAAGPSLDGNALELKKAKGKSIILAVDTALPCLDKYGIEPDFIVTLDSTKPIKLFENSIGTNAPLILSLISKPEIINYNKGPKIFYDVSGVLGSVTKNDEMKEYINSSGSVATTAFEIAKFMGAKTIILVGQDLSYKGSTAYASGPYSNIEQEAEMFVEGNNGEMLRTHSIWYSFLLWYNKMIAVFDGKVINATEGGAKIDGTEIMTLKEAIAQHCRTGYDGTTLLNAIPTKKIENNFIEEVFNNMKNEFNNAIEYSKEAIDICDMLIAEYQQSKEETYVMKNKAKKLRKINKQIKELSVNCLISDYIYEITIAEYTDIFNRVKDTNSNKINVYTRARNVYNGILEAATSLLNQILI